MDFQSPSALQLLLLIPVLILTYLLAQWQRRRYALRFATRALLQDALRGGPGLRRHIPPFLFLLASTAIIISLARPVAVIKVPSAQGTVILAIDLSASMTATDLLPSRLDAAKSAARAFVKQQPETVKIGVVSFSDGAYVVQAPTSDREDVLNAIEHLYPQRGTAIGRGLQTSLDAIFKAADDTLFVSTSPIRAAPTLTPTPVPPGVFIPAVVILLTDGENTGGPDPRTAARLAAERGVRVFTVGIGTSAGSVVRAQGRSIHTRLDEALLKDVAQTANGAYYNAADEKDLEHIYTNLGMRVALKTEKTEVAALWSGLAAALIILGAACSLRWLNRLA